MADNNHSDNIKIVTTISRTIHDQIEKEAKERELPFGTYVRLLLLKALKKGEL
jgi:hypothetical protein